MSARASIGTGLYLACAALAAGGATGPPVDGRALSDERDGRNWASYGRSYSEQHASPLDQVNRRNVGRLGLAWSLDLADVHNGATVPLAVDGTIYFTVDQSIVHAVDARSGKLLWRHDPQVSKIAGQKLRITWGPRGIAYWRGRIYVGTTSGHLLALDAGTGEEVWRVLTVNENDQRTITGPPRVFNDLVIIGHAGSEYGPLRGYVTAYDTATGKERWRFYTVPGNPADGFENDAMAMAARTWSGEWWRFGGGGNVWNAMTYDPKFNRIYLGTGNGTPWNRKIRSPGGGDNLFVCSIVALDADTGEYQWHYQTVPGESWDYNSAMDITLARLRIAGRMRDVILHAPKNGFFYVIDRKDGRLLGAEKFAKVTWAERIDLTSGRPIEAPGVRYENAPALIYPGGIGAHNWQPMSFNAAVGLVYIPTQTIAGLYDDSGIDRARYRMVPTEINPGIGDFLQDAPPDAGSSELIAWDPIGQRRVWAVTTPGLWNGGTMTTAGDLVFQGQADGRFNAYDARNGKRLWSFDAHMGISGAPISFLAGTRQYIAVVAGFGGAAPAFLGSLAAQHGWRAGAHPHRLLVFTLDGKARLPGTPPPAQAVAVDDPTMQIDSGKAERGAVLYARKCTTCHGLAGVAGGFAPDLRASPVALSAAGFASVVRGGALELRGMPAFAELDEDALESIRHYLRQRARESLGERRP
ncbi:MAG: PQQ-dependent dehydrogenase, methanol/ethanol family [Steroidobacteraceae bacterium]